MLRMGIILLIECCFGVHTIAWVDVIKNTCRQIIMEACCDITGGNTLSCCSRANTPKCVYVCGNEGVGGASETV